MKYVLVIYEGVADAALDELEGSTPLQLARNVNATALTGRGESGCFFWALEDRIHRSEAALALLLGVGPTEAKSIRRGSVEAAAVIPGGAAWTYAYRGNFVATDGVAIRENRVSGLSIDETQWLTEALNESLEAPGVRVAMVGEGRTVVTFDRLSGAVDPGVFPEAGMPLEDSPVRKESDRQVVMRKAGGILASASINDVRVDLGENPANGLWLWGGGPPVAPSMVWPSNVTRPLMVTNSPLARGMAVLCGMETLELGDVWSEASTPDLVKTDRLYQTMLRHDLTVVYVEAPGEGGRFGGGVEKVKAIDRLDIHVLGRLNEVLKQYPEHRLMIAALPPDGMWIEETPVVLSGSGISPDAVNRWSEAECADGALGRLNAQRCLHRLAGE